MWLLLMWPRFGGANHASGHDDWSRYHQVGFPGSWSGCARLGGRASAAEASVRAAFLREALALPSHGLADRLGARDRRSGLGPFDVLEEPRPAARCGRGCQVLGGGV